MAADKGSQGLVKSPTENLIEFNFEIYYIKPIFKIIMVDEIYSEIFNGKYEK